MFLLRISSLFSVLIFSGCKGACPSFKSYVDLLVTETKKCVAKEIKQKPCRLSASPSAVLEEAQKIRNYCHKKTRKNRPPYTALKISEIMGVTAFLFLPPKRSVCGKELENGRNDFSEYIEKISKDKELSCQSPMDDTLSI